MAYDLLAFLLLSLVTMTLGSLFLERSRLSVVPALILAALLLRIVGVFLRHGLIVLVLRRAG